MNVCKQTFHTSHVHISQKVKGVLMWNLQHNYLYMKTKILTDFDICISVPLRLCFWLQNDFFPLWNDKITRTFWVSFNKTWQVFTNSLQNICLKHTKPLQIFKGCFPQILISPFLNTLSDIILNSSSNKDILRSSHHFTKKYFKK